MNGIVPWEPDLRSAADRARKVARLIRERSDGTDSAETAERWHRLMNELFPADMCLTIQAIDGDRVRIVPAPGANAGEIPTAEAIVAAGYLVELAREAEPVVVEDLQLPVNDPCAPFLAGVRSLIAVPTALRRGPVRMEIRTRSALHAYSPSDAAELTWAVNLEQAVADRSSVRSQLNVLAERDRRELEQIARLQQGLLPKELPKISTVELAYSSHTTAGAGGDYYDVFRLPGNRWGVLLADVCGHGAAAAMVVSVLHSLVRTYSGPPHPPGLLLGYLNKHLAATYTRSFGMFVTAVYVIYDPDHATLTWSNAGHPPPRLIRCSDGTHHPLVTKRGYPLGVVDSAEYPHAQMRLKPADQVLLYTDGVTDAENADRVPFGEERLDAALQACPVGAEGMIREILAGLDRHTGGAEPTDDRTMVAMKFVRSKKKAGELSGEWRAVP